jgi:hypothetical protein
MHARRGVYVARGAPFAPVRLKPKRAAARAALQVRKVACVAGGAPSKLVQLQASV